MKHKAFAERLRALRVSKGLSKAMLANRVNVSQTCVWNWEEGNTFPRSLAMYQLTRELGTTRDYLAYGHDGAEGAEVLQSEQHAEEPRVLSVQETIQRARSEIARVAGVGIEKVRVLVEFGDENQGATPASVA